MKWLQVFAVFLVLHLVAWLGAHVYRSQNPSTILVVVDTSFALKPQFVDMQDWIDRRAEQGRYERIVIGTDKAMIGDLDEIRSRESIFRTAFGKSRVESFQKYESVDADERVLLSDGSIDLRGWTLVTFP